MSDKNTALWVALAEALGPRSAHLSPLLAHFGTPEAIFAATEGELLAAVPTLKPAVLHALLEAQPTPRAAEILKFCARNGVAILTPDSAAYPAPLRAIAEPPAVLYCHGRLPQFGQMPTVGVVGARHADAYGERMAYKLSFEMAAAGAIIVSGLAEGVDGIAAAAALEAGAPTVAVLGTGIDRIYPKHHKRLFGEVAEFGAVITEFAPGTPPNAWHFPMRNRLISALSDALVVVRAGENSGALITARYALFQGKALFAVPGNADEALSVGTNRLLRGGAMMATCAEDVLSHFRFLYPDLAPCTVPDEAVQYSLLQQEILRAHGIKSSSKKEEGKTAKRSSRSRREVSEATATKVTEAPVTEEAPSPSATVLAEALATLGAADRALYDLLPDGPFTVDVLVGAGVGIAASVAAMTLFEILGLVKAGVGGTYVKL